MKFQRFLSPLAGKDELDYSNRRKNNKRFVSPDPRHQDEQVLLYYLNHNVDSPPASPRVHSPTKRVEDPFWDAQKIKRKNIALQQYKNGMKDALVMKPMEIKGADMFKFRKNDKRVRETVMDRVMNNSSMISGDQGKYAQHSALNKDITPAVLAAPLKHVSRDAAQLP